MHMIPSPIFLQQRRGPRSSFCGIFLGTPFGVVTCRSTLCGTFPDRAFGASLNGRQNRTSSDTSSSREPSSNVGLCPCEVPGQHENDLTQTLSQYPTSFHKVSRQLRSIRITGKRWTGSACYGFDKIKNIGIESVLAIQDAFDHCNFGAPSPLDF